MRTRLTRTGTAMIAVLMVVAQVTAACGDGSGDSGAPAGGADIGTRAGLGAGVPASLEFLGELVAPSGAPVIHTFGAAGGSAALDDGVTIEVSSGAFSETTDITAHALTLDHGRFFDDAPWGAAFVVSTDREIALGAPVAIVIERPASALRAVQMIDGTLVAVEVRDVAGAAHIVIPHFSEVAILVTEAFAEQQASLEARAAQVQAAAGDSPADFLRTCIFAVNGMYGGLDGDAAGSDLRFAGDIAFSVCTNALVRRSSPLGVYVSTACVGDRISDDVGFQAAVDWCAADGNGQATQDASAADQAADNAPAATAAPAAPGPPVDPGPSAWSGNLTTDSEHLTPYGDLTIDIDRTPGTDSFTAHIVIGTQSITDFFEIGECTTVIVKTFDGTGTFSDVNPSRILLEGTQDVDWQYPDCSGITENDAVREHSVLLDITETGLAGDFEGFDFVLAGVPVAISG